MKILVLVFVTGIVSLSLYVGKGSAPLRGNEGPSFYVGRGSVPLHGWRVRPSMWVEGPSPGVDRWSVQEELVF